MAWEIEALKLSKIIKCKYVFDASFLQSFSLIDPRLLGAIRV